jgi:hypothetical protein
MERRDRMQTFLKRKNATFFLQSPIDSAQEPIFALSLLAGLAGSDMAGAVSVSRCSWHRVPQEEPTNKPNTL